jgi:hypothetical protein
MLLRRRRRSAVASAVAARLLWLLNGAAVASEDAAMMVLLLLLPLLLLRSLAAWACCARVPKGLAPAPAPAPNVGAAAPNAVPRGAPNELPPPNPALLPAPNPPPKFMVWRSKFSDSHDGERGGARRRARQGHGFIRYSDSSPTYHVFLPRKTRQVKGKIKSGQVDLLWEKLLQRRRARSITLDRQRLLLPFSASPNLRSCFRSASA